MASSKPAMSTLLKQRVVIEFLTAERVNASAIRRRLKPRLW